MSSAPGRRQADIERLRALATASAGRLDVQAWPQPGQPRFELLLHYQTVGSPHWPAQRQAFSRLVIELAPRHPFMPPTATVKSPIHHPHVFPSGVVCLGARWLASEGMDLFVIRIVRLLAFDPLLINPSSVAHREAMHWYQATQRRHPEAFPTDAAALALGAEPSATTATTATTATKATAATPAESTAAAGRVLRHCPHCRTNLRLPAGRQGTVACPHCGRDFEAST
jgi:uncharacterized Zn-finger protein